MPGINVQITPQGPLVDLIVGISNARRQALLAAGQAAPADVPCRMLIDTGATTTNLCDSVVQQLGLTPTSTIKVLTPSTGNTPVDMPMYDARLLLQFNGLNIQFDAMPVIGSSFIAQGFHGLLGRDILAKGLLVYHGDMGICTLQL